MSDLGTVVIKSGEGQQAPPQPDAVGQAGAAALQAAQEKAAGHSAVVPSTTEQVQAGGSGPFVFDLPDGRKVTIKEPPGSISWRAATLTPKEFSGNAAIGMMIQSMLYITHIDGQPEPPISTFLEAQHLADKLGDEGITLLQCELTDRFPMNATTQKRVNEQMKELRGL